MRLSKYIFLEDPESGEELKAIVVFDYSPPQGKRWYLDPTDYPEVEIIKFLDQYGDPIDEHWASVIKEWENNSDNINSLMEYAQDVD